MEEKVVKKILEDINKEILSYTGENLLKDGLLDSFDIMEIVAALEEAFELEIDPELITVENFATVDTIINLVRVSRQESGM